MLRITPRAAGFSTFSVAWDADHRMEPHVHEDHELNVAVSGAGRYVMGDGRDLHFAAGQILFIPGGWLHTLKASGPLTFRGLLVHPEIFQQMCAADPAAEGNAHRLTDLNDPLPPRAIVAPHLYQTLIELHGQSQIDQTQADAWHAEVLRHLGRLTAVSMLRLLRVNDPTAGADPVVQRVLNVRAWIDRHFAEPITLDVLAEMANLSPSHFSAIFRAQVKYSPKAYLLAQRLDQAGRLLTQTGLSILEIAWSVGFNHLAHFNRSFKAHTGQTPGGYRKKHQKEHRKA